MTEPTRKVFDEDEQILLLVRRSGKVDAEDFISNLEGKHRNKLFRYMEYKQQGHRIKSPENLHMLHRAGELEASVLELKTGKHRLYVVEFAGAWYLSHGRAKPKDSRVQAEVEKALTFYYDCTRRMKER